MPDYAIDYLNGRGTTQGAQEALMCTLQNYPEIKQAWLLTESVYHCIVLHLPNDQYTVVRGGFASGHGGEGAKGLSRTLLFLNSLDIVVSEVVLPFKMWRKVDDAKLSHSDITWLQQQRKDPSGWQRYILAGDLDRCKTELWGRAIPAVPMVTIDSRLHDVAMKFWDNPDAKLLDGFRMLETIVRNRIGSTKGGIPLFQDAFQAKDHPLDWPESNQTLYNNSTRSVLFLAIYSEFRNARAHNIIKRSANELLSELLMLNQLFRFEAESVVCSDSEHFSLSNS
jgi:hypothetical protein